MREEIYNEAGCGIVFDADLGGQIGPAWFDRQHWSALGAWRELAGGRGGVAVITTPVGECMLRHYRRGGFVARLLGDRYLWHGRARTRSFAEFRLLARIVALDLPGPVPVAARYVRKGGWYAADLITRRIPDAVTLAERLAAGTLDAGLAAASGAVIARFHRAGIWHADLNAHNLLAAPDGVYCIDFDRGRMRRPQQRWRQANLRRLHRSFVKLGAAAQGVGAFERAIWRPLLEGYARGWDA